MKCQQCNTEKDASRLPRGWKRLEEAVYCRDCWRSRYVLRAVTFPVVGPIDRTWAEFRETLKVQWVQATGAANWMMTECYVRDIRREPGVEKMPKMPKVYLYPETRVLFPGLEPRTCASLEQSVQAKYRKLRYKLKWTNEISLANHRYPVPLPVHNQAWQAQWYERTEGKSDKLPIVRVRIEKEWWTLRLRGGREYRRQLAAFRQIESGDAIKGELAIYRVTANNGDHRNGGTERRINGLTPTRVMVKLVAWLPRQSIKDQRSGTLYVRTDGDSLLIALNAKDERIWAVHADQLRRWVAEHRRQLQRWSDDSKAELRPTVPFADRRGQAAKKYHHRMKTLCQTVAAQLVEYARRRKFAEVKYDDTNQRYVDRFPYFDLKTQIQNKCDEYGIAFASGEAVAETK